MNTLLRLQALDLQIEARKQREAEFPQQKGKFAIHRERLAAELQEREEALRNLTLEQRESEREIEEKRIHIAKYDQQLFSIKKNEEYQALLHEIDLLKKQIGVKEERILAVMMEADEVRAQLEEDKQRIDAELKEIDRQCDEIDQELAEAVQERQELEARRSPLVSQADPELLGRYERIRESKKSGPAVVPLNGEACSGCHMHVPPQIANEVLAGEKIHACSHCGRLLYHEENFPSEDAADGAAGVN